MRECCRDLLLVTQAGDLRVGMKWVEQIRVVWAGGKRVKGKGVAAQTSGWRADQRADNQR